MRWNQRFFVLLKFDEWWALDSFNQRARDSSSLERIYKDDKSLIFTVCRLSCFIWAFGACTYDFFKNFRGQRYKNEEDPEELWAERRRELPPRQERSPRRHGAGPLQDEPAAGARVKTSVERRRPTAFRDGGRSVFLFKTGKYWNGKGRNIPYKWRFKSRNLAQRPKLRFGCLTKRR